MPEEAKIPPTLARKLAGELADAAAVSAIAREIRGTEYADELRSEIYWMASVCDSYGKPYLIRKCKKRAEFAVEEMVRHILGP